MNFQDQCETSAPADPALDYCLWAYEPPASASGKMRSYNLLLNSYEAAGLPPHCTQVNDRLRRELGDFQTVWGTKWINGRLSWEYYFYDYRRLERVNSIEKVLSALAPQVPCPLVYDGSYPYFMFSLDIDDKVLLHDHPIDHINAYIGNEGSNVSSGISYILDSNGTSMGNLYYFFDAKEHWQDICSKVACSAHIKLPELDLKQVLWPELVNCQTIVVANKRHNDSVYFSRITVDQLLWFLHRMAYPQHIVDYVDQNRRSLDHLLYDVGIDYVMRDGEIVILKSGYYGVF